MNGHFLKRPLGTTLQSSAGLAALALAGMLAASPAHAADCVLTAGISTSDATALVVRF